MDQVQLGVKALLEAGESEAHSHSSLQNDQPDATADPLMAEDAAKAFSITGVPTGLTTIMSRATSAPPPKPRLAQGLSPEQEVDYNCNMSDQGTPSARSKI